MIVGIFDPLHPDTPVPLIPVSLLIPSITQDWVSLFFLLDTGASTMSLHPADAIHVAGISPARLALPDQWNTHDNRYGVGGGALYYVEPCIYAFQHADDSWQQIDGEVRVAQLRPDNQTIPSLLGWDVLRHFEITIDHRSKRILLS